MKKNFKQSNLQTSSFSKKKIMLLYLFFCIVVFNCLDDFTVYWVPILKYFAVRLGFPSPSNGLKQRESWDCLENDPKISGIWNPGWDPKIKSATYKPTYYTPDFENWDPVKAVLWSGPYFGEYDPNPLGWYDLHLFWISWR